MKKLLFILIMMLMIAGSSWAQVTGYLFTSSAESYTGISGGTVLGTGAIDDNNYNANNIGFSFSYNGAVYTQFSANANGFIAMGATVTSSYTSISSATTNNVIAAGNEDLQGNVGAELSYQLSGTSPNQVLTIQWKDFRHYSATGESYNFQIMLYETSNVIQLVYGSYTKNSTTRTQQVGLRGASNADFNNRTTTTDWSATTAGALNTASCTLTTSIYPSSGLTYTFTPVGCFAPSGVTASAITATTATISWTASSPAPSNGYQYEVRTSGTPGSGPTGLTASGTTVAGDVDDNIIGLTNANTYYVYVRSDCGGSNYSGWAMTSFFTPCGIINSYPYTQSFAAILNPCWPISEGVAGADQHWAMTTADATHGVLGPQAGAHFAYLYVYLASATYNPYYLQTATFNLGAVPKQIKYYYYLGSTGYTTTPVPLTLQISTDNGSTWNDLYQHTTANSTFSSSSALTGWVQNTVNLSAYTNQTVIFRFASNSNYGSGYCDQGLDEVVVEDIPACPNSTVLTTSNITAMSAILSWTTGGATHWNIEYGPQGFTPGTGTKKHNVANPYTLNGLTANTSYSFYVQDSCNASSLSTWAGPNTFTTLCDAIASFPYTENFDGTWIGAPPAPNCWKVVNNDIDGYTWRQGNNYITPTHSTPNAAIGMGNQNDYLITPQFVVTTNSLDMKWWDKVENATYNNTYDVLISTTTADIGSFTINLGTFNCTNTAWVEHTFTMSGYSGQSIYIAFHQTYSRAINYGFGIDDFSLDLSPACPASTSLTASNITQISAELGWTTGGATQWNIEYGPSGFTPGTGIIIHNVTNPYTLNGLTSGTVYDFYVQDSCGATDLSTWAGPRTFTTACSAVTTFPFTEDFSAGLVPPLCWSEIITNTSDNWEYNADAPGYATVFYDYSQDEWLITPILDFTALASPSLSFGWTMSYYWSVDPFDYYDLNCKISTDGGTTWTLLWTEAAAGVFANYQWYTSTIDLTAYAGQSNVKIAWQYIGDDAAQAGIDNIVVYNDILPKITSLGSTSGCEGSSLVINGANLDNATSVTIGGTAATITGNSASTVTVTIGAGTTGTVTITTALGTATSVAVFTVHQLPSSVTATASSNTICAGTSIDLFSSATSNAVGDINYTEGFETWPPSGWSFLNAGLGNDWIITDYIFHGGSQSMAYSYAPDPADAWAFTPALTLVAGTPYTISFWYKASGAFFPEKLKVTVGSDVNVIAQATTLWDNNGGTELTNETWEQATINYTPSTSGIYYFGFNCYSEADENYLAIDDVSITGTSGPVAPTYSWTSVPAGYTSLDQNPTGIIPTVTTEYIVTAENLYGCVATASTTVIVDPCTGIEENDGSITVSVVPNPSNGLFYISVVGISEIVTMNIYSVTGQVIYSEQFDNSGLSSKPIDLKSYPKGMYFLRLTNNNMTHTEKIIIE